jgi:ubiquinone/menaquinone biosynthesis C-methylase UbiE
MTWEEAVQQLRKNESNLQGVLDNYFEADIFASVERFSHSEEFTEIRKYIPQTAKTVLEIGAGRGMASYAFAKIGLKVTALEPDKSDDIGSGAIKLIQQKFQLPITVVETIGEQLPFNDKTFDVVYVRQVLHHANDLTQFCKEAARVLNHGGVFIATREHVISKEEDLTTFLKQHPLHKLYGGENAFTLKTYLNAIKNAPLSIRKIIHPYASVINYFPLSTEQIKSQFSQILARYTGIKIAKNLVKIPLVFKILASIKATTFNQPGRLYSFIAYKK